MSTLRVSNIEAKADLSSPSVHEKIKVTNSDGDVLVHIDGATAGITTVGINTTVKTFDVDSNQNISFTGDLTAPNITVTGTLSYDDVTNVDSLGIVTARSGINVSGGQLDVGSNIKLGNAGIITATAFHGDGSQLTGIDATQIQTGNTSVQTVDTGSDGHVKFTTEGTERLRITPTGEVRLPDNGKFTCGAGDDLQIFHTGSNSLIQAVGTGDLYIDQLRDDGDIRIRSDNGSGGFTDYVKCDGSSGATILYHYGTEKFTTTSDGIDVTGAVTCDEVLVDGPATIRASGTPILTLKDTSGTGGSASAYVLATDQNNANKWYIGDGSGSNENLTLYNYANADIQFYTNTYQRLIIDNAGHLKPATTNTYDLGTDSLRWANIYGYNFDFSSGKVSGGTNGEVYMWKGNGTAQVYVSDSGNDSTGDGTSGNPVRSFNRACELLPKVMGTQTFQIRIQGSTYTTPANQYVRGFSFNGVERLSRYIEITGDTQTVTVYLRHGVEFQNVHGLRITGLAFNVESGYSGYLRFDSCSESRVYNSCTFTSHSTHGWSERIGFYNTRKFTWEANITVSSSASSGLGGFVVIADYSVIDMGGTMTKSGTRFGNTGIAIVHGSTLRGGVDVNNFATGMWFGVNHYAAETGGRGMLNGASITNCTTGIRLWNNSFVRKYSHSYSGNGTDEIINTNGGNFS